jgi:hypothetical protein
MTAPARRRVSFASDSPKSLRSLSLDSIAAAAVNAAVVAAATNLAKPSRSSTPRMYRKIHTKPIIHVSPLDNSSDSIEIIDE